MEKIEKIEKEGRNLAVDCVRVFVLSSIIIVVFYVFYKISEKIEKN